MKRTAIRHLWPLLALALLVWGAPAAAQTGAAMLRVDPPTLSLIAGQTQTITIVIQDAAEVYGIDVRASFDPALVEVVDANPARDGVQMTTGVFPQPDFVALNAADNAAGALRYVVTQVNPTPPATGGGVVFTFQMRGRANGVSPLRVDLVEMANRSGELLPVTTTDGAITVTGGQPPAPTGIALTMPAESVLPATTVAPTPTIAAVAPAATEAAATRPTIAAAATSESTTSPTAQPQPTPATAPGDTASPATTASVEADAVSDAATQPVEPTAPATAGDTSPNSNAAPPPTLAAAGDTAVESAAPPAVIGADTDATGATASTTSAADGAPGGVLLIGGAVVLALVVAVIVVVARRGRG